MIIKSYDGRVLGDKEACALVAKINPNAFATYQRDKTGKHDSQGENPVPQPVMRDLESGRLLTDLEAVLRWAAKRPRGPYIDPDIPITELIEQS